MRDEILTKLTSCECWQHAFDFEIVVDARLSLVERLAHTAKATGNRDNLMGLYLSKEEEKEEVEEEERDEGGQKGREQSKSSEGQFTGRD